MGFGNIGIGELMMILLVVMLVFGPKRLPGIARDMGKFLRDFRRETNAAIKELKEGIDIEPINVGIFDEPDEAAAAPAGDGFPAPGVAAAAGVSVVTPAEALAGDGNGSRPRARKPAAKRKPSAASPGTRRKTSTSSARRKPASAKSKKRATPSKGKGFSARPRATRKR